MTDKKLTLDSYLARHPDTSHLDVLILDLCGNGMHIHLSLIDDHGNNIFDSSNPEDEKYLAQAVAGLQASIAESMAFFAPNISVYRRFKPDEFVPVTKHWGENNRSVAFRIPPDLVGGIGGYALF